MSNKITKATKKNPTARKIYFSILQLIFEIKYFFQKKLMRSSLILLYHRVDTPKNDPHSLSVSPENFRKQLEYLKENFTIIKLSELAKEVKNGKFSNKVSITFDDGYEDNLINALPILQELNIPATIFVTTEFLDKKGYFYWEKDSDENDRGVPLSSESLKKLADSDLIEIGAHTISHPNLKHLDASRQKEEILQSKLQLENIIGKEVAIFSYPFGTNKYFSNDTVNIVKESGYTSACANEQGRITFLSKIFTLPRIVIRNDLKDFVSKL